MLDVRRIRHEPDAVKAELARRGDRGLVEAIEAVLRLDAAQRALVAERDGVRARVKQLSREVGPLVRDGRSDEAAPLQAESRALGDRVRAIDERNGAAGASVRELLLGIPNTPSPDAPDGAGPDDNVVVRTHGFDPGAYGDHQRVPHWVLGAELGILDPERASKLSGSMFALYRGAGARLLRALTQLALDRHSEGPDAYQEVRPPTLVRTETMVSTGHLPRFAEDAYHLERDDLWAIPTAEVPLTSMARDELLAEDDLPLRFCAATACYRREAGSAGRDTRGVLRTHEFDKVELFAYCTPEQAPSVHADILARAEALLVDLGLAYRVLDLCAGDLGFSNARTFDLEVWAPGCGQWLEVSSVSWYADFQARRANVRYRPSPSPGSVSVSVSGSRSGPAVCHTLNGSALAWPRVWAALVETHRRTDGSVAIPDVLQPYMGTSTIS